MLVALAVNAQTDFAAPGYSCAADDAVLTGGSASHFYLQAEAEPHYVAWADCALSENALATWTVSASRGCYVTVSLDLGPVIASNKHNFEVTIKDASGNVKGMLTEGGENTASEQVKALDGTILMPAAGTYTVEVYNNRDWGKGSIKNVILTYAADAPAELIPVSGIELNKPVLELEVAEVEQLIATVSPEDAFDPSVTWVSSDETVVTVVDGFVSAIAAGTATITATAGEMSATCPVTVAAATIPSTDFAEPFALTAKKAMLEGAIWKMYKDETYKLYGDGGHNKNYGTAIWNLNVTKACSVTAVLNGVEGGHTFVLDLYNGEELVASLNQPDGATWSADEIAMDGSLTFAAAGNYILKLRNTQEWSSGKVAGVTLTIVPEPGEPVAIYLAPDMWETAGAKFAVYAFQDGLPEYFSDFMALAENETAIYTTTVPANYGNVVFMRLNDGATEVAWNQIWNQTEDMQIPEGMDMLTITSWSDGADGKSTGAWSKYEPSAPVADEWAEIKFAAAAAADDIAEEASYTVPGTEFALTLHDSGNKMVIDGNDCRFGTAEAYTMYNFRLKSGGASGSDKNYFTLNIPEAGTLRIAPRTGSNSATDRALIVIQGGETLYNQIVQESQAIEVQEGENTIRVYPYVDVTVAAGEVVVRYTGSMNFYAFVFKAAGGETPVVLDAPDAAPAAPTYEGYQVHAVYSATYNADCNFGEWSSGTQYTQEEFGKKYVTNSMGYFGLEFTGMDCSTMEALHLDVWTAADASIRIVPIHGGTEVGVTAQLEGQKWNTIDIALSEFEGVTNWSNVYQIKIDNASNLTFWLNNVYFYTTQEKTVDLVDGYYLIGNINGWDIHNLTADHLFAVNPANEAEYILHYTLAEGNEFKVVAVANNELGAWYPGEAGNYVVDFAHVGEKDILFRPDYQGGEGWHAGCIFVEGDANANPWETWFASGDTWNTETESYLEWDGENQKATVHINVDKYGQWRAQVKYHGPVAEAGKCYRVALKLKSNNAISNVTIKYQDNAEMIYVADAALEANVEYVFDQTAAGIAGGNGIMVLDFGFAHAGDIIEIYDVVIEETECPAIEHTYTVAGGSADLFGTTWDPANTANDMTKLEDGTYKFEKTEITLPAGNVEFKVVEDHAWTVCYPAENYQLVIPEAGVYTITITFNPEGNVVAAEAVKTGDAQVDPVVSIAGSMNSWNASADVMVLAEDKATASLTLNLAAQTYEFKVVINGGDWRSNAHEFTRENATAAEMTGNLDNMHLVADVAGDYIFTWTFATNTLAITFPTNEGINNTAVENQVVKMIENGQLIIIKNGVRYNAQGAIVR